jgi:hypothetical protein
MTMTTEQLLALKARCWAAKMNRFQIADAADILVELGGVPNASPSVDDLLAQIQKLSGEEPSSKPETTAKPSARPKAAAPTGSRSTPAAKSPTPAPVSKGSFETGKTSGAAHAKGRS